MSPPFPLLLLLLLAFFLTLLPHATSSNSLICNPLAKFEVDIVFLIDTSNSMKPKIDGVKNCFSRFANSLDLNEVIPLFSLVTFGGGDGAVHLQLNSASALTFVSALENLTTSGGSETGLDALLRVMGRAHSQNFGIAYRTGGNARKVFILITNEDSDVSWTPANRFSNGTVTQTTDKCFTTYTAAQWAAYQREIDAVAQAILDQDVLLYSFVAGQKSLADGDVPVADQCNTYVQYCNPDAQTQTLNNLKYDSYSTLQKLVTAHQAKSVQGLLLTNFHYSRCYDVANTLVTEFVNSFFTLVVKDTSRCGTVCPPNSQLTLTWDPDTGYTVPDCECLPGHVSVDGLCPAISCESLEYENATYPQTLASVPSHGVCDVGFIGSPILLCQPNGSWSTVVESPCIKNVTQPNYPACRNPQNCGEIQMLLVCKACSENGGLVLDLDSTACFCPETNTVFDPRSETCATPLPLCPSTYFCHEDCQTCNGPNATQCLSCADDTEEPFPIGLSAAGPCHPPCQSTQYVTFDGQCADPNCSRLSNCSAHGSCIWDDTKSVCFCDNGFKGDDCSENWNCSQYNHCSENGDCVMSLIVDELECHCDVGWAGTNCATNIVTVTPSSSNELGGELMTIKGNFSAFDNVTCHFGQITSVPATVIAPNAYCQIPPHHTASSIAFSVAVNGISFFPNKTSFYYYSKGLPATEDEWNELVVSPNTNFEVGYNISALSGATVNVSLFCWRWDYLNKDTDPVLVEYGVIGSGPNSGNVTVNLNRTFDWSEALCILSFGADEGTWRRYALPLKGYTEFPQLCTSFRNNAPESVFQGACLGQHSMMDRCKDEVKFPNLFPDNAYADCWSSSTTNQVCFYGSPGDPNQHLYEPYVLSDISSPVVQYLVSTQLPKFFCCTANPHCNVYLQKRRIVDHRRAIASPPNAIHQMALAQVFGNLHFITLDGSKYTFNGMGEFILLKDPNSTFAVQIRTAPLLNRKATRLSAVSINYLDSKLTVHLDPFGRFLFLFNDELITESLEIGEMLYVTGGQMAVRRLEDRVLRVTLKNDMMFTLKSNSRLAISIKVLMPLRYLGSPFQGLLGSFDDNRANDFTARNGSVLSPEATDQEIHFIFGLSWNLLSQAESLFIYASGMAFEDKNQPGFLPEYPGAQPYDPELTLPAQLACKGIPHFFYEACVFDIVQTRTYSASSPALAMGHMFVEYVSLATETPVITGLPDHVVVHLGELVSLGFNVSHSPDVTTSTFVSSSPEPFLGTLDPSGLRYEFYVSLDLFFDRRVRQAKFTIVDSFQGITEALTAFSVAYTTCEESEDSVEAEAKAELDHFCLTTCTQSCKDALTRIEDLPCSQAITPGLSPKLEQAKKTCINGVPPTSSSPPSSPPPPSDSLSGGQIAGLIIGLLLVAGILAVAGFFIHRRIKARSPAAYVSMNSQVDLGYDRFDVEE